MPNSSDLYSRFRRHFNKFFFKMRFIFLLSFLVLVAYFGLVQSAHPGYALGKIPIPVKNIKKDSVPIGKKSRGLIDSIISKLPTKLPKLPKLPTKLPKLPIFPIKLPKLPKMPVSELLPELPELPSFD